MQMTATQPTPRSRATFLMTSQKSQGHLMRVLDLARGLVSRGHRVLVYSDAQTRAEVESAGAELVPFQRFQDTSQRQRRVYDSAPEWIKRSLPLRGLYLLRTFRRSLLDSMVDFVGELVPILHAEQVDCVVHDYFSVGAGYAAEAAGIPCASTGNAGSVVAADGLPLLLRMSPVGGLARRMPRLAHAVVDLLTPMRQARAALRLPSRANGPAELFRASMSTRLHIPTVHRGLMGNLPLRDNQLFMGPISFDGGARKAPDLTPLAPGTILLSTTSVGVDHGLMRKMLLAVAPLERPVLATTVNSDNLPEGLGPHIRLERFVPHEQVLPHVTAAVTHGGWGMVGRALRHGVPMLVISIHGDQPLNGRLLEAQGLAYHLPLAQATPETIRERLRALLEDRALHARVKQVAEELRTQPTYEEALDALEHLAFESAKRRAAAAA